jgi:hypothetical protein
MDEAALFALILAAYGAVLATINAAVRIAERRRSVKVELAWGFGTNGGMPTGSSLFVISATNAGGRDVTLSSVGLILPNGKPFALLQTPGLTLPFRLHEGANCGAGLDPRGVAFNLKGNGLRGKVRLVGYFSDTVGKTYKSKPMEFDIDYNVPASA